MPYKLYSLFPFRDNRNLFFGGVTAAILVVATIALLAVMQLRQQVELQTSMTTQNMAKLMEQTYDGMIDTIDVALFASADEISHELSTGKAETQSVTRLLLRQQERLPIVNNLRASNERGDAIYGPGVLSPPINTSDRDYFIGLRDNPNPGLFVSKPFIGRHKNKWVWLFARRINKADGSFGGVVYASIFVDELDKMLAKITLDTGGVATLRDSELGLIARHVFQGKNPALPGDKKMAKPFLDALNANRLEGTYVSDATSIDSIRRTQSYRRSAKYGYYVNVGISSDAALQAWRRQAWMVFGVVACFILALLAFSRQIVRAWLRQDQNMEKLAASQKELHESAARIRRILEFAPIGMATTTVDGHFIMVNQAFCNMLGYQRHELEKMCFLDVTHPEDMDLSTHQRQALLEGEIETYQLEKRYIHKNGQVVWVLLASSIEKNDPGKQPYFIAQVEDITARKQEEAELLRSNAELEQFSYAISHDMRQPLRMISSYLQLLEMTLADKLDGQNRDYFNFAIDGAKRIDQMLVALLEYSRVGRMGKPPDCIDSRAMLDEALLFLQPAIHEAQAKLDIIGDWPRIMASSDEITRLIQNLIGNAIKYRIAGRIPEIIVSSAIVHNEWHLSIADNGVGINPEQTHRLFKVFQRLHSRDAYEGTGIGLALCRKIVEHHKGRIWAESAGDGQGSKFCVELPVLQVGDN
jgi:PAS domain S-box-containing protein